MSLHHSIVNITEFHLDSDYDLCTYIASNQEYIITHYRLDPRNTLDSEELLNFHISEANRTLDNDSTRRIHISRQDPEYPLLSTQAVQTAGHLL